MIRIITDTASDITGLQAAAMDVARVPLRIHFDEAPYDPLADEDFSQFYSLLESSKSLPTTSQTSPGDYLPLFQDAKEHGDTVIAILLSGALSGTVQSAHIAKDMAAYNNIHIIDSRQAIIGQRLLVEYAVRLRDEGKSAACIVDTITDALGRIRLFGALQTLKYLRKGGRIPKSTEMVGTVLGIKPIISLQQGSIVMAGKARGHAGAMTAMVKLIGENTRFDPAAPVYFGYTQDEKAARNFRKLATVKYHLTNTAFHPVGPVVGTHIGPGAFAVAYLVKD